MLKYKTKITEIDVEFFVVFGTPIEFFKVRKEWKGFSKKNKLSFLKNCDGMHSFSYQPKRHKIVIHGETLNHCVWINTERYESSKIKDDARLNAVIAHECFHLVSRALSKKKFPLIDENEELYAYSLGEATENLMRNYSNYIKYKDGNNR